MMTPMISRRHFLDDTGFMRSSVVTMKLVAAHAGLFDCHQFVTWSASHSPQFRGTDPRNHIPEAVAQLQRAIREIVLPVLEPIGGRVAFEPFFLHVTGTLEMTKEALAPFRANRVGLVLDPPNFISPELHPKTLWAEGALTKRTLQHVLTWPRISKHLPSGRGGGIMRDN